MTARQPLLSLGLWLLSLGAAWAQERPLMQWAMVDLRPYSSPQDGRPGDGMADWLLRQLARDWPELEHRYSVVSAARAQTDLKAGVPACWATVLRTPEREAFTYFAAFALLAPVGIVTRAELAERLPRDASGAVLLPELLARRELRGLRTTGRSYGAVVDAALAAGPHPQLQSIPGSTAGDANRLQMLMLDRVDYLFEFDAALSYQQRTRPELFAGQPSLVALPLAGPGSMPLSIGCPRTPWGREAILRIDAAIARLSQTAEYREAMTRWFSAPTLAQYKREFAAFFKDRARLTPAEHYAPEP